MLDERVFLNNIRVVNHASSNIANLSFLGKTKRGGSRILVNSDYMKADIKILTGVVESHFMAGFSGGAKVNLPGLIGKDSVNIFHGATMLSNPQVGPMQLRNNPCHEEALEIALKAGADYIVNVTLDREQRMTAVFAGDLVKAHEAAAEYLRTAVSIPIKHEYDIVIAHAGGSSE